MPQYLERQHNTWHATMKIPQDVRHLIGGKTKFYQTLGTTDLREAEIRKHEYIGRWKRIIKNARAGVSVQRDFLQDEWRHFEGTEGEWYARSVLFDAGHSRREVEVITGERKQTIIADHIPAFLDFAKYAPKNEREARNNLTKIADKFPVLEDILQSDLRAWVRDQIEGGLAKKTVVKRVGYLKTFYEWACDRDAKTIQDSEGVLLFSGLYPQERHTKAVSAQKNQRKPYEPEDLRRILKALKESGDETLRDLVLIGLYSGMRFSEMTKMTLDCVDADRFRVIDAKTSAGWREVPIHREISQLVARLVSTSTDCFLISGLSTNAVGERGKTLGIRFSVVKKALGFGPEHNFHSLRRTLATAFQEAGVPEAHAAEIFGHSYGGETYGTYSGHLSFKQKREIMDRLVLL